MNCANHPDVEATAYCRTCGKALCSGCQILAQGTIFCAEHAVIETAAPAAGFSPYSSNYSSTFAGSGGQGGSPGLAFFLGLIPGVGAIYNGQYAKGVVHVVVLGILLILMDADDSDGVRPVIGLLIPLWFFYMAFEAYHTALKRQRGLPLDEFSSVFPIGGRVFPAGPVLLIGFGILLLMHTLGAFPMRWVATYGPSLFLIGLGCYLLYARLSGAANSAGEAGTPTKEMPSGN